MPPVLILIFGIPTQTAIATSLASVLPTTVAGAFSHYWEGNVGCSNRFNFRNWRNSRHINRSLHRQFNPSLLLQMILGALVLIMLILMLRSAFKRRKRMKNGEITDSSGDSTKLTGLKRIIASFFRSRWRNNGRNFRNKWKTCYCRTL